MTLRDLGPVVIELRKNATHIQWRPRGTGDWDDLVSLSDLMPNIETQKVDTEIQWRVKNMSPPDDWKLLFDLSDIQGSPGPIGNPGVNAGISRVTCASYPMQSFSHVEVTMLGPSNSRRIHFEFYIEDAASAINRHIYEEHRDILNFIQKEIANVSPTLELSDGVLYLKKPNGQVSSFVNIGANN